MKLTDIHIRDPFILPDNGKYYMYGTRGHEASGAFFGLDVYESNDLENWSDPHNILNIPPAFWGTEDCWAPEVHKYKDKYYMFVSFKSPYHRRATHIFVSDSPGGLFSPHSSTPVTPADWECLDGTFYIEDNIPYMIFCHEWQQTRVGEICAIRLTPDLKNPTGDAFVLFNASEPVWADGIETHIGTAYVTDGPFLYKTSDNQLFMIWSSFSNGKYIEAISFSDNGKLSGNWNHCKSPLFKNNGGHGMFFRTYNDKLMFIIHSPNHSPNERPVLIEIDEQKLLKLK